MTMRCARHRPLTEPDASAVAREYSDEVAPLQVAAEGLAISDEGGGGSGGGGGGDAAVSMALDLARTMLNKDPAERPSAASVLARLTD